MNTPRHAHTTPPPAAPQPLPWLTPQLRRWAYMVITALVPLLVAYGVVENTSAPLWLALAASLLGTGTAYMHTPTNRSGKDAP